MLLEVQARSRDHLADRVGGSGFVLRIQVDSEVCFSLDAAGCVCHGDGGGGLPANDDRRKRMSNFILVHGSWHGAWCWYKIVPRLRALGHSVRGD